MNLGYHASRVVDQRPDVVHDRLLELAARLRDEAPPVEAGTQAATMLGVTGPVGIEIADRGPGRIELRSTRGRVLAEGVATIEPTPDGRTTLALAVDVRPDGFAANLMLGAAVRMMPGIERQLGDGLEQLLDELAVELAKPDAEWDPASWQPSMLPARS